MIKLNNSELSNVVGGNHLGLGFKSNFRTRAAMVKGLVIGKDTDGSKLDKNDRLYAAGEVAANLLPVVGGIAAGALAAAGAIGTIHAIKNRNKIVGYFKNRFGKK